MISIIKCLNNVYKNMRKLGRFGENTLFISQYKENEKDKASVIIICADNKGLDGAEALNEGYLVIRRLLNALKYRIEKDSGLELNFELKRKEI